MHHYWNLLSSRMGYIRPRLCVFEKQKQLENLWRHVECGCHRSPLIGRGTSANRKEPVCHCQDVQVASHLHARGGDARISAGLQRLFYNRWATVLTFLQFGIAVHALEINQCHHLRFTPPSRFSLADMAQ